MTDRDSRVDERLGAALDRHASRFEPTRPEWARIEARYAVASRRALPGQKLVWLSVPGVVAAALLVVAAILPNTRSPALSGPVYQDVTPVPVHAPGTAMAAIQSRGFVRVGVKVDQPRFGARNAAGDVEGFDVDIARLVALAIFGGRVDDLGDRVRFVPVVSKDREATLQDGKVDMIVATYSITPERREKVDFAGPYFSASQDIMTRAGDTTITSVADLTDKRVCTARGSTSLQNLVNRNAEAVVVARDTYSECATALAAGEVDAVTTDQPILAGYAVSDPTLRVLHNPFSHEDYGIGIPKGDEALRSFINDRLAQIQESGDWGRAARYWLGDIYLPPPIDTARK